MATASQASPPQQQQSQPGNTMATAVARLSMGRRVRRARRRAARWRQAHRSGHTSSTPSIDDSAPSGAGRKRPACQIADDDADAAFDQGFTIDALSMTREEFIAAVPPERRLIVTVGDPKVRVAFDIVEVYRWLRTNPNGGICGPFGQLPVEQHQRDAIVARAERLLPKRQRVSQEAHFDYAWHDQGDDLHYHDAPSGAYLRERVVAGDHEGVLYCLDALAPGDIDSPDEARRLLVRVANASLTTMFERMVAHEEIGGRLGVDGLLSLIDDIIEMHAPRIDILVPTCRAVARLAGRACTDSRGARDRPSLVGVANVNSSNQTHDDHASNDDDTTDNAVDDYAATKNTVDDPRGAALEAMQRAMQRVYTTMCIRTARNPVIDDSDDSDDSDDDVPPIEAGCISQPSYSAAVRAVFEATAVTPNVSSLAKAIDVSARDLLDFMLGVARLSPQDALALALHAVNVGCERSLCLVMHHNRDILGRAEMEQIARAAAGAPPPLGHVLGVVVAVQLRGLGARASRRSAAPACPRRMRFADD
ncbi:hypothetical protein pmac_cds_97 [Pandoravirus macleodensis]|uniref:Uncharacterized protein n=1 Tax=Pandoravirus macleodensis TaxID=2107707 RepID=A0A2U7UEK9_9VIRU|nr:hypothetical protein pmac_cds_97 [Pandoravirus macleodensis]AVK76785.1 hypothetical protein pmac_cds_97 [Pandoravirus macleodensis]